MVQGQSIGDKASNLAHQAKEAIPGTQEHKANQQGYSSANTFGSDVGGRNNDAAFGSTTTQTGYGGQQTGLEGQTGYRGQQTGFGEGQTGTHAHTGHHQGHHTHAAGGLGDGRNTNDAIAFTGVTQTGYEGQTGTHTHTGHHQGQHHNGQHQHHNAGNLGAGALGGATGGNLGSTVDTHNQTPYDGVAKHVPGTDAHDVHQANREVGRNDYAGQPSLTDNLHGAAGRATGGTVGSTVNTPNETTKEKILKHIPGTEANKEKKAQQETGF